MQFRHNNYLKMLIFCFAISFCFNLEASRIVIVGWGSLIWNPGNLEAEGQWKNDGPILPIEFSRLSIDGRLTLVIDPKTVGSNRLPVNIGGKDVKTLYILSNNTNLVAAIRNLRLREGTKAENIGYVNLKNKTFRIQQKNPQTGLHEVIKGSIKTLANVENAVEIQSGSGVRKEMVPYVKKMIVWTRKKSFDAAIWTGLESNFESQLHLKYTVDNAIGYLSSLVGEKKQKAMEYINKAPVKNQTKLGPRI